MWSATTVEVSKLYKQIRIGYKDKYQRIFMESLVYRSMQGILYIYSIISIQVLHNLCIIVLHAFSLCDTV